MPDEQPVHRVVCWLFAVARVTPADLQMVNMSLRLLSKPNEDKLSNIFKVGTLAQLHGGQHKPAGTEHPAGASTANPTACRLLLQGQLQPCCHRFQGMPCGITCSICLHLTGLTVPLAACRA